MRRRVAAPVLLPFRSGVLPLLHAAAAFLFFAAAVPVATVNYVQQQLQPLPMQSLALVAALFPPGPATSCWV